MEIWKIITKLISLLNHFILHRLWVRTDCKSVTWGFGCYLEINGRGVLFIEGNLRFETRYWELEIRMMEAWVSGNFSLSESKIYFRNGNCMHWEMESRVMKSEFFVYTNVYSIEFEVCLNFDKFSFVKYEWSSFTSCRWRYYSTLKTSRCL